MLKQFFTNDKVEAGCDEAGRGCLAGPVFAAAVILPKDYVNTILNDSKQISESKRYKLRVDIEKEAIAWSVAQIDAQKIDEINILKASFLAMHNALDQLSVRPEFLLIDGNRFVKYNEIHHECIIKGDGKYLSIAAASILAKTYRDDYMRLAHKTYPEYEWNNNKGYPTLAHKMAIQQYGLTPLHRKSFNSNIQLKMEF